MGYVSFHIITHYFSLLIAALCMSFVREGSVNKKKVWKYISVMLVTVLMFSLAPEVRLFGLLIDSIGIDIFLLLVKTQIAFIFIGVYHQLLKPILSSVNRWLEKIDPYYFLPSVSQIKECPVIVFHAAPFLIGLSFMLVV